VLNLVSDRAPTMKHQRGDLDWPTPEGIVGAGVLGQASVKKRQH
jgi:hypothetical protein